MIILAREGLKEEIAIGLGIGGEKFVYDSGTELAVILTNTDGGIGINASTLNLLVHAEIHSETGERWKFSSIKIYPDSTLLWFLPL